METTYDKVEGQKVEIRIVQDSHILERDSLALLLRITVKAGFLKRSLHCI